MRAANGLAFLLLTASCGAERARFDSRDEHSETKLRPEAGVDYTAVDDDTRTVSKSNDASAEDSQDSNEHSAQVGAGDSAAPDSAAGGSSRDAATTPVDDEPDALAPASCGAVSAESSSDPAPEDAATEAPAEASSDPPDEETEDVGQPDAECATIAGQLMESVAEVGSGGNVHPVLTQGDGWSTMCVESIGEADLCVRGTSAANEGDPTAHWGAALVIYLAQAAGDDEAPFDALAASITGIAFELVPNLATPPLHLALSMVDDPAISAPERNFERNVFLWGEQAEDDGAVVALWEDFALPDTSNLDTNADGTPDLDTAVEPSRLRALLVSVGTGPIDVAYDFCLTNVRWVN